MPEREPKIKVTAEDQTGPGIKSASNKVGLLTKMIKSYWAEMLVAYAAMRKIVQILGDLANEWGKQEKAIAAMNQSLKNAGIYTPVVSLQMQELANQLQKTTIYGDETTEEMIGLLASLGRLSKDGLEKVIPLVQDMASTMGMDLNTAAALVGKTLGSSSNALARYGFQAEKGASQTEKLVLFVKWATDRFGGMSAVIGETFQGRMARLNNQISDIKENLGRLVAEGGRPFTDWITDLLIKINDNFPKIERRIKQFAAIWGAIWETSMAITKTAIEYIAVSLNSISKPIEALVLVMQGRFKEAREAIKNIGDSWKQLGIDAKNNFENIIPKAIKKWDDAWGSIEKPLSILEQQRKSVTAVVKQTEELSEKTEELKVRTIEYTDELMRQQEYIAGVNAALYEQDRATYQQTESNKQQIESLRELNSAYSETQERLTDLAKTFQDYAAPAIEGAWESIWTTTGDTMSKIKDAAKQFISDFLRVLAKHYLTLAAVFLLTLQFRKAALYFAASAGLYAASMAVMKLQQGGTVKNMQQGGRFGDSVPAMLEPGEAVIPKRTVQRNAAMVGLMQTGGGGTITIPLYLDGREVARSTARHINNGRAQIDKKQVVKIS